MNLKVRIYRIRALTYLRKYLGNANNSVLIWFAVDVHSVYGHYRIRLCHKCCCRHQIQIHKSQCSYLLLHIRIYHHIESGGCFIFTLTLISVRLFSLSLLFVVYFFTLPLSFRDSICLSPYFVCTLFIYSGDAIVYQFFISFRFGRSYTVSKRKRVEVGQCEHQLQVQCSSCNGFFSLQTIQCTLQKKKRIGRSTTFALNRNRNRNHEPCTSDRVD